MYCPVVALVPAAIESIVRFPHVRLAEIGSENAVVGAEIAWCAKSLKCGKALLAVGVAEHSRRRLVDEENLVGGGIAHVDDVVDSSQNSGKDSGRGCGSLQSVVGHGLFLRRSTQPGEGIHWLWGV